MHPKQNTPTTLVANAVESPDPRSVLQTPSLAYVWSPVDSLAQGKHMGVSENRGALNVVP